MLKENTVVPLVDLQAQYVAIHDEINDAIQTVLNRMDFIQGKEVGIFEEEFAAFSGNEYAVACNSGTDALSLACRALDIGPGDEVIMPAFTFVATALGVSLNGSTPVFVDVEPANALIDSTRIAERITPKTKAIIPVHLYGQCVDMRPITRIANEHGLFVIEDAAQAHGASFAGHPAGSFGDIGCFSFYPGKNLGAYGDGGMVTTGSEILAARLRVLGNLGSQVKYQHVEIGINSRLDTLQAAILRVKLRYLEDWNNLRKSLAKSYDQALGTIEGIDLTDVSSDSVYHLYVIRVNNRDEIQKRFHEAGIFAGVHYPFAVHELKAYQNLGYKPGDFPVSEDWARRCISLPIYPEMPVETIERSAEILRSAI